MTVVSRSGSDAPAVYGGRPAFPEGLLFARPSVPPTREVLEDVEAILSSGMLTNGPVVRRLEQQAARYLDVRHCIAVSSGTTGLMLVLKAADLSGDVIVPSFTLAATAHALVWNGLRPVFTDIDPKTLTLSPAAVARAVGVRTSAILAAHTYGTPCDIEGLAEVADRHGIRLFFDAAHAFGSKRRGVPVGGFGHAEVFSLSPTDAVVGGEGGIIATNDDVLAERCRIGRDHGNPGDDDCRFVGLNARMSEIHAALALRSLSDLEPRIQRRNELVTRYRTVLAEIPGISFAEVGTSDRSTYTDFTVLVDPGAFGLDARSLSGALTAEGIDTRRSYSPPLHSTHAYRSGNGFHALSVTENASARVLTLPLWSSMNEEDVTGVAHAIERLQRFSGRRIVTLPEATEVGERGRGA